MPGEKGKDNRARKVGHPSGVGHGLPAWDGDVSTATVGGPVKVIGVTRGLHERPALVIWELSPDSDPPGPSGPGEAASRADPDDLTFEERHRLLPRLTAFGEPLPVLVLAGGHPFPRRDSIALTAEASKLGFPVALASSAAAALTTEGLEALQDAGLAGLAVGLDSPDPAIHDGQRGIRGVFDHAMGVVQAARALGVPIEIDTRLTRQTLDGLPLLASLVATLGAVRWRVSFPLLPGPPEGEGSMTPLECESTLNDLHDLSLTAPFLVEVAEAPQYRRVILERRRGIRRDGRPVWAVASRWPSHLDPLRRVPVGSGKGLLVIDHRGEVHPSPFIRASAGSVRWASPVAIYRTHPLFRALRDPERLRGRCGRCPFRVVCGGSRARAFTVTGDPLAEDRLCLFTPCPDPLEAPAPPLPPV